MRQLILFGVIILFVGCSTVKRPKPYGETDISHARHRLKLINNGHDALLTRVKMIREAKDEVCIQTFIWAEDEIGLYFFYELLQAAKRGVKVKIIADQMFSISKIDWLAYAVTCHPNIEIRLFNPNSDRLNNSTLGIFTAIAFKMKSYNSRMHNKLFIADGLALTGGRNIENCYYDRGSTLNFKDRDVLVSGPVVSDMKKSFKKFWDFNRTIPAEELKDVAKFLEKGIKFPEFTDQDKDVKPILTEVNRDLMQCGTTVLNRPYQVQKVGFFADDPEKNSSNGYEGSGRLNETVVEFLKNTKKSVKVQSPYLVLNDRGMKLFNAIRKEKPELDITFSTNSLCATDSWQTYAYFYKEKRWLLEDLQAKVFEYKKMPENIGELMPKYRELVKRSQPKKPYLCLHAKTVVIDNQISLIGSYNIDPRSANLTTEVHLVVWDDAFAKLVVADIDNDCSPKSSWVVAKKNLPLGVKQVDDLFASVSGMIKSVTSLDLWPVNYASCFELKPSETPLPVNHKDFYKNYNDVGSFPELSTIDDKIILIRLLKSLGKGLKPLM